MARFIFAIPVRVAFFAALMAIADDFFRDLLAEPIVENKILSLKFVFKTLFLYLMNIFDNAAFKMKNLCKTVVQQIRACFFTANSARAIHNYILVFFVREHLNRHRQLFSKRIA